MKDYKLHPVVENNVIQRHAHLFVEDELRNVDKITPEKMNLVYLKLSNIYQFNLGRSIDTMKVPALFHAEFQDILEQKDLLSPKPNNRQELEDKLQGLFVATSDYLKKIRY